MTVASSPDTRVTSAVEQTPPIGSLLYLASYLIRLGLSAEVTPPDTPDMYSADLEIQGDTGEMVTDKLMGPRGYPGKAQFPLRRQDRPVVSSPEELPDTLTNTTEDIGKYWEIDILDFEGVVKERQAHTWFGNRYRILHIGTTGVPGMVPEIQLDAELIAPQVLSPTKPSPYPDTSSFVDTSGPRQQPSWRFELAVPRGISGTPGPVAKMKDVDIVPPPVPGDLFACTGRFTTQGAPIWGPLGMQNFATQYFSVPESSFTDYDGDDQRAPIGSFTIPAMPFRYTPIVWGHLGSGGVTLSARPLMVGCEVRLNSDQGQLVARGLGNSLGEVNIVPHYSDTNNQTAAITPENNRAIVSAGQAATLKVNLWNEGLLGIYHFRHKNAQLFVLVQPMQRGVAIAPFEEVSDE